MMAADDDSGSCRHHRWTRMEIAGRLLVLLSTSLFVSGILITAFAFGHNWVNPGVQLAMQITGPSCLMVTFVMWFFGCIFFHLWNSEWKRNDSGRDQMNRVRLRALKRIPGSPGSRNQEYRDSHIQTLLLGSKTQSRQTSVDRVTWLESSLDGASISSTRKKCSLPTGVIDKNSSKTFVTDEDYNRTSQFQGVESTSYDSRLMDGTGRFVIIHSQVSTCSSYSLAGSRSSRSRGSRTSSNMSSIFLDGASLPEMDGECADGGPRTPSKQAAGEKKGSVTMATLGVAYPSNYYLGRRRSSGSSCGSKKRDGSGSSGRGGSGQEGGGSSNGGRRGSVPGMGESIQQTVFHVDNFVQGSKIKRKSSSIKTDHIVILKD